MTTPSAFLIPGWGLGRGPLAPLLDALPAYECIDLPGYGTTPLMTDFDAAVDYYLANTPPGAILGGWSLGAMLALACAARQPAHFRKILLIAGTPSFVQREGWPHAMPAQQLADFTTAVAADFDGMLPRFVGGFNRGDSQAKTVTKTLLEQASPKASDQVMATGLRWLAEVDLRSQLTAVTVPTVVIHGAHDPLMPLEGARWLAEQLPQGRLEIFEDSAHAPFVGDQPRFIRLLEAQLTTS